MRMHLLILGSLTFLTACGEKVETRTLVLEIPQQLLTPVPISERRATTLRELSLLATEHLVAAQRANSQLEAIAEIQTCAKARAKQTPC